MKEEKSRYLTITLILLLLLSMFFIILSIEVINDKNAYINGLLSDRAICNGKLDNIKNDYGKMEDELKEYQEKYGEVDG